MSLIDDLFSIGIQTLEMILFRIYYPCMSKEFTSSHVTHDMFIFLREEYTKQYCVRNEKIQRKSRAEKMGFEKRSDSDMNIAITFVSNRESGLSKKIIFTN